MRNVLTVLFSGGESLSPTRILFCRVRHYSRPSGRLCTVHEKNTRHSVAFKGLSVRNELFLKPLFIL